MQNLQKTQQSEVQNGSGSRGNKIRGLTEVCKEEVRTPDTLIPHYPDSQLAFSVPAEQ